MGIPDPPLDLHRIGNLYLLFLASNDMHRCASRIAQIVSMRCALPGWADVPELGLSDRNNSHARPSMFAQPLYIPACACKDFSFLPVSAAEVFRIEGLQWLLRVKNTGKRSPRCPTLCTSETL
jgi:hypothetical protein